MQCFQATAHFHVEVEDIVDSGQMTRNFMFTSPNELILFMQLVDKARAEARVQHAAATNELN